MATTSKASQSLLETPPKPTTTTIADPPPVNILSTPAAQTYSHVHPAVLLALYAVRFPALVADPISTLLSDLPIFTVLQVAYVVTCLPQAGSTGGSNNADGVAGIEAGKKASLPSAPTTTTPSTPSTPAAAGGNTVVKVTKTPYRKKHAHASSKKDAMFKKLTVRLPPSFLLYSKTTC
jgi:phosphatidylinositol glycan class F